MILAAGLCRVRATAADEDDSDLMTKEQLGMLRINLPMEQVLAQLGTPARRGKESMSQATGEYEETWQYPSLGLTLTLSGEKKRKTVAAIDACEPCRLATRRGIKVGSPLDEVNKAYGGERVKSNRTVANPFIAGSRYGGIRFDLKGGKVSRIYIGPFAE